MASRALPRRAALLAGMLPVLPRAARAQDALAQVMAGLRAVRESRARFVEEKHLPELERPLQSRGVLLWRAPDRLEKHTLEPVEERLVVEGDRLVLDRPSRGVREVIALDAAPEIRPLVEAIRATLAGDLATLRAHHDVAFSGSPAQWRIVLSPRSMRVQAAVQRIVLEGQGADVLVVETQGSDGRTRLMATPLR